MAGDAANRKNNQADFETEVFIPKRERTQHPRRIQERIIVPLFRMAAQRHLAKLLMLRLAMVQTNKRVNIKYRLRLILKMMLMLKEPLLKRNVVKGEPKNFPLDGKRQV